MKSATLQFQVHEPDYSKLPEKQYNWSSIYGEVSELLPKDAPEPLGKHVVLTHYVDANLFHNALTGRSVTGILHMLNAMPIYWYSKKQGTVETATYGSEFVAAHVCIEQIVDSHLRFNLCRVQVLQYFLICMYVDFRLNYQNILLKFTKKC